MSKYYQELGPLARTQIDVQNFPKFSHVTEGQFLSFTAVSNLFFESTYSSGRHTRLNKCSFYFVHFLAIVSLATHTKIIFFWRRKVPALEQGPLERKNIY